VWYNPDELARDSEVLYLLHGLCFINPASTRRKSRSLPRETCAPSLRGLRPKQFGLTSAQESAEGVVPRPKARLVRHSKAEEAE
jgi:hypothetical protein